MAVDKSSAALKVTGRKIQKLTIYQTAFVYSYTVYSYPFFINYYETFTLKLSQDMLRKVYSLPKNKKIHQ